ncbi:MAG: TetR/AcrR family transcriptional regulator [Bacilli bacterium]|nr:TetR/AcrR family transcriptional regulator [Bacilli bacterium]
MKMTDRPKLRNSSKRTIEAFCRAEGQLLATKPYRSITVQEICEIAQYPRATFYNYFDNKSDLLDYLIISIVEQKVKRPNEAGEKQEYAYFKAAYDILDESESQIMKIIKINSDDNDFLIATKNYLEKKALDGLPRAQYDEAKHGLPYEIYISYVTSATWAVLKYRFFYGRPCTKEQAVSYLRKVIDNI